MLLIIDYLKNKSLHNIRQLVQMFDYFDFEDEKIRMDIHDIMLNMHILGQRNYLFEVFKSFDPVTIDYAYSIFDKECLIMNKNFPCSLIKSPFIRIRVIADCYWPYFQVGPLKFEFDDLWDLIAKMVPIKKALGKFNAFILRLFEDIVQ